MSKPEGWVACDITDKCHSTIMDDCSCQCWVNDGLERGYIGKAEAESLIARCKEKFEKHYAENFNLPCSNCNEFCPSNGLGFSCSTEIKETYGKK